MTKEEYATKLEALTPDQKELFQLLEFGCAGCVAENGKWIVFDTYSKAEFDYDPQTLLGPLTAYPINLPDA